MVNIPSAKIHRQPFISRKPLILKGLLKRGCSLELSLTGPRRRVHGGRATQGLVSIYKTEALSYIF